MAWVAAWLCAPAGVARAAQLADKHAGQTPETGPRVAEPAETAAAQAASDPAAVPPAAPAAAAKTPDSAAAQPLPPARRADAPKPAAAPAGTTAKPYVIGSLDVLYVRVWGNANLTGLYDIRPDGILSMPLIGELKADGTTVEQLTGILTERLKEFLNQPEVNVQVSRVNSKKYYIFGEVGRPGEFPLVGNTTVLDALSSAGGFREFANQKKIYILRGTKKLFFNYKEVSNGKNMDQNIQLENGDRIFVP